MDKVIKKRLITKRRIVTLLILLVLTTIFLKKVVLQDFDPTYRVKISDIMLSEVKEEKISNTILTVGLVEPVNRVFIETTERGKVVDIVKKSGSRVNRGDSILTLNNEELNNQYILLTELKLETEQKLILCNNEYKSENIENRDILLDIEYKLEQIEHTFETNSLLYDSKAISKSDYKSSEKEFNYWIKKRELFLKKIEYRENLQKSKEELIRLELNSVKKRRSYLKKRIDRLTLKSPYSGILNLEDITIGQNIRTEERVAILDRQDEFILTANIDEYYLADLNVGDRATFSLKGDKDTQLEAKLRFISPNVQGSRVKLEFDFISKLPPGIISGQSFNIKILQDSPKIKKVVENGSFFKESGGNWAYKLVDNGAVKVPIKIGTKNSDYIEIVSGLDIGDKIIISNYKKYKKYNKLIIEEIQND